MELQSLNPKYTFENFVVDESNKLPYNAALAATGNVVKYTPILIYGGAGVGKTHLMHAIAQRISHKSPEVKL